MCEDNIYIDFEFSTAPAYVFASTLYQTAADNIESSGGEQPPDNARR